MTSSIEKLKNYGARPINKAAAKILSKKKKIKRLSPVAQKKIKDADSLKVRRCAICKITYVGSLVEHKLSKLHKENKYIDMLLIKRPKA